MKVAYLLGSLSRGGLETLMLDVFKNKDKADFEFIAIYRKSGLMEKDFMNTGVPMYKLRPRNVFDIRYVLNLRKILKQNDIDIIHSQTRLDAMIALIVSIGLNVKIVTTYHYGKVSKNALTRFVKNHVDLNLFVSEYQKKLFNEIYPICDAKRARVIYNGLSFEKFKIPIERCGNDSVLQIGSVGNFTSVRSQLFFCRFIKLLKEKEVKFQFYFVGAKSMAEPSLYDDCVAFCENNNLMDCVNFLGSRNDVPELLSTWDAYVYCTISDSFGISVVEAIASGLPTFVNDYPVMKEVTNNGEFAVVYEDKNEFDLLDAFLKYVADKETYKTNAVSAANKIREIYSIENFISNLSSCYKSLI